MSESFGLNGVGLLSFQLEMYRWEDHWKEMRHANQQTANYFHLSHQYDQLADQFNALLDDHTKLRAWATDRQRYDEQREKDDRETKERERVARVKLKLVEDMLDYSNTEIMILKRELAKG